MLTVRNYNHDEPQNYFTDGHSPATFGFPSCGPNAFYGYLEAINPPNKHAIWEEFYNFIMQQAREYEGGHANYLMELGDLMMFVDRCAGLTRAIPVVVQMPAASDLRLSSQMIGGPGQHFVRAAGTTKPFIPGPQPTLHLCSTFNPQTQRFCGHWTCSFVDLDVQEEWMPQPVSKAPQPLIIDHVGSGVFTINCGTFHTMISLHEYNEAEIYNDMQPFCEQIQEAYGQWHKPLDIVNQCFAKL